MAHRLVGAAAGRQLDRLYGLHSQGTARRIPRQTSSSGGVRILPVRAADDEQRRHQDARRPRRTTQSHPAGRFRRMRRLVAIAFAAVLATACQRDQDRLPEYVLSGEIMGTSFSVKIVATQELDDQE